LRTIGCGGDRVRAASVDDEIALPSASGSASNESAAARASASGARLLRDDRSFQAKEGRTLRRWGFIYTLGDDRAEVRRDVLGSAACELICVGIPDVAGAAAAARSLLDDGVELIELCGAFEGKGLAAVVAEVDGAVPAGAVFYGGEAAPGLHRLFG
jgi:hypothetical protein